jgi:serine/threonine protein kinase
MSIAQHRLALPAGYQLGRYELIEILGSGGFGITYLAHDRTLNRRVAIKELLPNDIATRIDGATVVAKTESEEKSLSWARERFVDEGRALAACDHPNVVNVYEMVEANGTAYMVTKYEEGRSLEEWLRELGRPPNESELRSILTPLLSGLETVHQAGFLHRDIKPDNIYITKNGRPLLLDFGSARQAITNRSMALTSIVTSGYAPFEQYHEDGKQGAWSDIYALSAVMYRAITGKKPPEATRRLKDDPCEKLSARAAGQYSPAFLQAIDDGLVVDESKRPQSVAAWRALFEKGTPVATDDDATRILPRTTPPPLPITVDEKPAPKRAPSPVEWLRSPSVLSVGVPAAVLLLLAFAWMMTRGRSHSPGKAVGLIDLVPAASPNEQPSPAPSSSALPSASPGDESKQAAISPAPGGSPPSLAAGQLDPRLVGKWESGRDSHGKRAHWEQFADGHYTLSGPVVDTGVISGADGQMKQFSNASGQPIDVTYQFNGPKLVTASPTGSVEWQRIGESSSRHQSSSHNAQPTPHRTRGEDIGRDLIRRTFGHGFP